MASKQSSGDAWLGLDLGTQSVRAMAVSGTGEMLTVASHKLTSRRDGPRHEQDAEEWWRAISTPCREALTALPAGSTTIYGVAVDGTSGTVLFVDGNGRPLTPGLMYDDRRATGRFFFAVRYGALTEIQLEDDSAALLQCNCPLQETPGAPRAP